MSQIDRQNLAQYIDHTCLSPGAVQSDIEKLCSEARTYQFKTVCVSPQWVTLASELLAGSTVWPITVVAFPGGEGSTRSKEEETKKAVSNGAKEIDMVLNRSLLKAHDFQGALEDIQSVVRAAGGVPVKVILETSELSDTEKIAACVLSKIAGAAFVKTSTGFSKSGATVEDIRLLRETVGSEMGVKASGGVRTLQDALAMIEAGASRIGMSASVKIMEEFQCK